MNSYRTIKDAYAIAGLPQANAVRAGEAFHRRQALNGLRYWSAPEWRAWEQSRAAAAADARYRALLANLRDIAESYPATAFTNRPAPNTGRPGYATSDPTRLTSLYRDQSEDRAVRYYVVAKETEKGLRYFVKNARGERVTVNANAAVATHWAALYEREHPKYDNPVSEEHAEQNYEEVVR